MAELFRFRCYQCQKLMGAPPSRFGKVVKCPGCGAELVVPSPDDGARSDTSSGSGVDLGGGENDLGIDLGGLDLNLKPTPARATSGTSLRDPNFGVDQTNPISAFLEATPPEPSPDAGLVAAAPDVSTEPQSLETVDTARRVSPLTGRKPIAVETDLATRRRDVVLPRTVVLAWALSALLGLGFAFLAGLMIGHSLW